VAAIETTEMIVLIVRKEEVAEVETAIAVTTIKVTEIKK
jgi:hypothetical protein